MVAYGLWTDVLRDFCTLHVAMLQWRLYTVPVVMQNNNDVMKKGNWMGGKNKQNASNQTARKGQHVQMCHIFMYALTA